MKKVTVGDDRSYRGYCGSPHFAKTQMNCFYIVDWVSKCVQGLCGLKHIY